MFTGVFSIFRVLTPINPYQAVFSRFLKLKYSSKIKLPQIFKLRIPKPLFRLNFQTRCDYIS